MCTVVDRNDQRQEEESLMFSLSGPIMCTHKCWPEKNVIYVVIHAIANDSTRSSTILLVVVILYGSCR
jgi:hypothetical protein